MTYYELLLKLERLTNEQLRDKVIFQAEDTKFYEIGELLCAADDTYIKPDRMYFTLSENECETEESIYS